MMDSLFLFLLGDGKHERVEEYMPLSLDTAGITRNPCRMRRVPTSSNALRWERTDALPRDWYEQWFAYDAFRALADFGRLR